MITANINDISTQLPRLIEQVMAGENVVFCKDSVPVMELKPVSAAQPARTPKGERMLGNPPFPMKIPEDINEPLPEEIWNMFNGYDDKHGL